MKRTYRHLGVLLLLIVISLRSEAKHLAVVVDKGNTVTNLTAAELAKIIQSNTKKWPDGKGITVVLRELSSQEVQQSLERLFKLSPSEVKAFIESHKTSFVVADSDEGLIRLVESTPGAVGLVDVYSITSRVNVLKVDGKLPLEQGYLLH